METANTSNYPITITGDVSETTSILATALTLLPLAPVDYILQNSVAKFLLSPIIR